MSFVFFAGGSPFSVAAVSDDSLFVVVRAVLASEVVAGSASSGDAKRFLEGGGEVRVVRAWTTSAMMREMSVDWVFEESIQKDLSGCGEKSRCF